MTKAYIVWYNNEIYEGDSYNDFDFIPDGEIFYIYDRYDESVRWRESYWGYNEEGNLTLEGRWLITDTYVPPEIKAMVLLVA